MTEDHRTPVTIIGLGSMGSALAAAYLRAGHPTTVWNRTAAKAAPLVAEGAVHAASVEEAVKASPLVLTCLMTHDATLQVLEPVGPALAGRVLVTLNSGTPADARRTAAWATERGARYLGGAIKNVPAAVGAEDTLLYYGGDRSVFDEHETTLKVMGGDTVHLGDDPDLAALYEVAVGATLLPALVGYFQGAAIVQTRGLKASTLVPYATKWFEMIIDLLPMYAQEIDDGDYREPAASVNVFHQGAPADVEIGRESRVDVSWQRPLHELVQRAVDAGHGDDSIAVLTELLKQPTG